jgi:DNA gyrase subunit B
MSYSAKDIEVLDGISHVRTRSSMYIPNTAKEGLHHLIFEIIDNSLDEINAGFGDTICLSFNKDNSITINDFGRGIPCELHPKEGIPTIDVVMTKLNAGGKFSKSGYQSASSLAGLHGVGASVVNALSEWLKVEVNRDGYTYYREYSRGKIIGDENNIKKIKSKNEKTGTKVTFKPDDTIFKNIKFDASIIIHRLRELSFLYKNIKFSFLNERDDKEEMVFLSENGLKDYISYICENKEDLFPKEPISFCGNANETIAEIVILYSSDIGETCISFCNGINTIDFGTHVSGFRKAFTRALNYYGRENKIIPEKEENLSGDDLRDGMNCIISVKVKNPQFSGQTKAKLNNPEVESDLGEIIYQQAVDYFKNNGQIAQKILDSAIATRKARQSARKQTELMRRKSVVGKTTLPGKLIDCASEKQEETELFLVEGLSAVGTARQARDARYQALLPLKGKIISSEKQSLTKILENQEIQDILSALGISFDEFGSDELNISKIRYGKLILLFDADQDGSHIMTLNMAMLLRYLRPLLENGMIWVVQPPLYTVRIKDKRIYCYSKEELDKVLSKHVNATVTRNKGLGENSSIELEETCMSPKTRRIYRIDVSDITEAGKLVKIMMGTKTDERKKILFGI